MALLKRIVSACFASTAGQVTTSTQHHPAIPLPHQLLWLMSVQFETELLRHPIHLRRLQHVILNRLRRGTYAVRTRGCTKTPVYYLRVVYVPLGPCGTAQATCVVR
jgi:hypothetical protein